MKKGLRHDLFHLVDQHDSNSRPDEEGIKTLVAAGVQHREGIPTADLMKKGLRPGTAQDLRHGQHSNSRPDEEGIKTPTLSIAYYENIPTADLMKKGLRRGP